MITNWLFGPEHLMITACGLFYALLCVFSIVTGIIYATGKRQLNPLELSDKTVAKLDTDEKKEAFAKKMGIVTFVVGIVQGITSFAILKGGNAVFYGIAVGFTIFSIGSVSVKLKGKINAFPILKAICYISILIVLLMSKKMFL
ncbi:MAG: hypothetical protein HUJ58_00515 [Erysipelotrichaceae bacterium]|nr:hypothetical protein [Erysipelotrichaceae bacterium]